MRKLSWALPFLAVGLYGCGETETAGETTVTVDATDTPADTGESTTTDSAQIAWASDYDAAVSKASSEGKLVMLKFTAEWCGPCKEMDAEAFTNSDIATEVDKLVAVKIYDTDPKFEELAGKYAIEGFPTLVFVREDGSEVDRFVGYPPMNGPETILASLKQVNNAN